MQRKLGNHILKWEAKKQNMLIHDELITAY